MRTVPFREVFHPSDFTHGDAPAFAHALRIALAAKGELSLLHVNAPEDHVPWGDFPSVRKVLGAWGVVPPGASHSALEEIGLEVKKIQRKGENPSKSIVDYLHEHKPHLLVLSTHQRQGLDRLLHPSKAEAMADKSHALTLFVPRDCHGFIAENGEVRLANVLIPVDHAPNPQRAVDAAESLTHLLGAQTTHFALFYAGKESDQPEVRFSVSNGWTFERDFWNGAVVDRIIEVSDAQNIDLIVMATRGHNSLLDALRGSTTERVLRRTKCPVLMVPEHAGTDGWRPWMSGG